MDTDVIKVFAATYVKESNISYEDKLYLVNFIKEAEKDQVLSLLTHGTPDVVTESECSLEYVEQWIDSLISEKRGREWHESSDLPNITFKGRSSTEGKLAVAAVVALAVAAAYLAYMAFLSKAGRACKGRPDRNNCIAQYKNKGLQAQIQTLKSKTAACSKTKDPAKCKGQIQKKISKLEGKKIKKPLDIITK